jgi:hypothetical protein
MRSTPLSVLNSKFANAELENTYHPTENCATKPAPKPSPRPEMRSAKTIQ